MSKPQFGVFGGNSGNSAAVITENDLLMDDIFQDFLDGDFGAFDFGNFQNSDDDSLDKKKKRSPPSDGVDFDKMERRYDTQQKLL